MAGYIGSKAVNLSTTGADINGDANIDGDLSFRDNDKIKLGAGSDLQIYHNGSNSYISEGGTGNLYIEADNQLILRSASGELYGKFERDSAVTLYYNNLNKLATTSTGIDVTGTVTADGLLVDGSATFDDIKLTSVALPASGNPSIALRNTDNNIYIQTGSGNIFNLLDSSQNTMYAVSPTSHIFQISNAEKMRIDSSGNVGIGVSSISGVKMDVLTTVSDNLVARFENSHSTGSYGISVKAGDDSGNYSADFANKSGTSLMRIRGDGNVGIGETDPDSTLTVKGASHTNFQVKSNSESTKAFIQTVQDSDIRIGSSTNHPVSFYQNGTERMRLDASGNLLVGKTVANTTTLGNKVYAGVVSATMAGDPAIFANRAQDGSIIEIQQSGTTVGSIGTLTDDLSIGNLDTGLIFQGVGDRISPFNPSTNTYRDAAIDLGKSDRRFKDLYLSGTAIVGDGSGSSFGTVRILGGATSGYSNLQFADDNDTNVGMIQYSHGSNYMQFTTNDSEAMRIDSSGNLLVGKTSTSTTVAGIVLNDDGRLYATGEGGAGHQAARFTRLSNDGDIVTFYSDSSTVGSIACNADTSNNYMIIGKGAVGLQFARDADADNIMPARPDNQSLRDNAIDLGSGSFRFDDIYATNGTIQTSDRNEKQDIAELSDAEQRVAVAAKGLLRKFRWRDAVAEKGDEARTHFGIIAQDLQAAFAAEGLDAGDYAMFISSTWTDEETGEERTRMGVRYSELLAFIIAAI